MRGDGDMTTGPPLRRLECVVGVVGAGIDAAAAAAAAAGGRFCEEDGSVSRLCIPVYVWLSVCMRVSMFMCVCVCVCMRVFICVCRNLRTYVCALLSILKALKRIF